MGVIISLISNRQFVSRFHQENNDDKNEDATPPGKKVVDAQWKEEEDKELQQEDPFDIYRHLPPATTVPPVFPRMQKNQSNSLHRPMHHH
mmetsp:Transcript_59410/g.130432  ORF Transcript_59410/g.130432 Transcript_59410/m.130432 type:complete len:90 (+) Transcript_59410:72-341(+)